MNPQDTHGPWWRRWFDLFNATTQTPPGPPGADGPSGPGGPWPAFGHAEGAPDRSPFRVFGDPRRDTVRFSSPARGEGHRFEVEVRCDWTGEASILDEELYLITRATLNEEMDRLREGIEERVEYEVRPLTRRYHPHQAAEVEHDLPSHLAGCFNEGRVQCHPQVKVDVCDEVRSMLAEKSGDLIELDAHGRYQRARIEQLRDLRTRWEELFLDALRGAGDIDAARATWLAPYALRMAETPENASQQLVELLRERRSQSNDLFNDLGSMIDSHARGDIDHVTFMLNSDHALRRMLVSLGLPVSDDAGPGEGSTNGHRP